MHQCWVGEPISTTPAQEDRGHKSHHINYFELLAAWLALRTIANNTHNKVILLRLDNMTTMAFLNRMGGTHSENLCNLAAHIWKWYLERNIFIHAEHLPGKLNVKADCYSRHTPDCSDWQLHPLIFQQLQDKLGPFSIDLFASPRVPSFQPTAAGNWIQQQ